MITESDIRQIVAQRLEQDDCFIVEAKVSKDNDITLVVDSLKGISVDYCIELSHLIEDSLDRNVEDFSLEVSSAGIGCVLQVPMQFVKNIGNEVEITHLNGSRTKGVLTAADNDHFEVDCEERVVVEGAKKKQVVTNHYSYLYSEIKQIKDIITFK